MINGSQTPQFLRSRGASASALLSHTQAASDAGGLDSSGPESGLESGPGSFWDLDPSALPVVTALYSYDARSQDELTLRPGDSVKVLSFDYHDSGTKGWWVGQLRSSVGVFPVSYVQSQEEEVAQYHNKIYDRLPASSNGASSASDHQLPPMSPAGAMYAGGGPSVAHDYYSHFHMTGRDIVGQELDLKRCSLASSCAEVMMIPWEEVEKDEYIGAGGFGTVYKGRWNQRPIAIKIFSVSGEQVRQEAGHLCGLKHRNIIRLLGVCRLSAGPGLVMELAEGGPLSTLISERPILGPRILMNMAEQVAEGMNYLHTTAGLSHRDLKSSNILIQERLTRKDEADLWGKTLVITDFGMARPYSQMMSQQSKFGTVAYAAPEVYRQQGGFSPKSDVWSFGVVLWELTICDMPHKGFEHPHLLYKISVQSYRLFVPDGVPSILADLLRDCWVQEPKERPTFGEILERLKKAQSCSFMGTSAEEFYQLQSDWIEQIEYQKIMEERKTKPMSESDILEWFAKREKEIATEREMLDKDREELTAREEAVHAKEQQYQEITMECAVLALMSANYLHDQMLAQAPPKPPPRKNPFTFNRFRRRGNNNSSNRLIGPPSNLQHIVHVASQDGDTGTLKIVANLEHPKVHTWGPSSMTRGRPRQSITNVINPKGEETESPMCQSAPNLAEQLAQQAAQEISQNAQTGINEPEVSGSRSGTIGKRKGFRLPRVKRHRPQSGSGTLPPGTSPVPNSSVSPKFFKGHKSRRKGGLRSIGEALRSIVLPVATAVVLGDRLQTNRIVYDRNSTLNSSSSHPTMRGYIDRPTEGSSSSALSSGSPHGEDVFFSPHHDPYSATEDYTHRDTPPASLLPGRGAHSPDLGGQSGGRFRLASAASCGGSSLPQTPSSPARVGHLGQNRDCFLHSSSSGTRLGGSVDPFRLPPPPERARDYGPLLDIHLDDEDAPRPRTGRSASCDRVLELATTAPLGSTNTLLDTDCPEDPTKPLPAAVTPTSQALREQMTREELRRWYPPPDFHPPPLPYTNNNFAEFDSPRANGALHASYL